MPEQHKISSALISVYHKEGLEQIIAPLKAAGVQIISTGGTAEYIRSLGAEVTEVAELTGYPSILGGRVKTLHPKIHGGILARRDEIEDEVEMVDYQIPSIDLVVVDLYPFEETVASGASDTEIIEKIDIGGIALIRAAAKNFKHVAVIPSQDHYQEVAEWLQAQNCALSLDQRKTLAAAAFNVSSHYDTHIFQYLHPSHNSLKVSFPKPQALRYGENPHQQAFFYGDLDAQFEQLNGKALSYNNLVDIDAALQLADDFTEEPFCAVIKHTNPCGCAVGSDLLDAWNRALECDPLSAFGGIIIFNGRVTKDVAESVHKLFFEVLIAPSFDADALDILRKKKKRIILQRKEQALPSKISKSVLNGFVMQERDVKIVAKQDMEIKSARQPTEAEWKDVVFGEKVIKHLKSNGIGLVKNQQLIGSGIGQTSRVDAVQHALHKAQEKGFDLAGSVLVSDAFFPFADSVELAQKEGVEVVLQPGGSVRDKDTIAFCEEHKMCLVLTGARHFRH